MSRFAFASPRRAVRAWVPALAAVVGALVFACNQGSEGDRCNPLLISPGGGPAQYNEDECHSPLTCQTPPTCAISVCCPTHPPYTDPNCACLANPAGGCACTIPSLLDAGSSEDAVAPADSSTDAPTGTPIDSGVDAPTDAPAAG